MLTPDSKKSYQLIRVKNSMGSDQKTLIIQVRYFGWFISDQFILHEQVHGMTSHQTFPHLITTCQELKYFDLSKNFGTRSRGEKLLYWNHTPWITARFPELMKTKQTIKSCGLVLQGKRESFHHPTWHSVPSIDSLRKTVWLPLPQEESSLPTNHPLLRCDNLRIRVNAGGAKWSWSSLLWKFTFLHKGRVFTYWRRGLRMTSLFWFCERLLSDHYFKLKRNPVCAFVVLEIVGIKKGSRPQLIIITIRKWTFRTSKTAKCFLIPAKYETL